MTGRRTLIAALCALAVATGTLVAGAPALGAAGADGAPAIGSAETAAALAPQAAPPDGDPDSYVVEQGEFCEPIAPLSSDEPVEEFYEYRSHQSHPDDVERQYSSYGTTVLQRDDASLLFLHEGPDGVSVVVVHDRLDGETAGGLATLEFVGLPDAAEWAVRDDGYDAETRMDVFDRGDRWAGASWIWEDARTDGGAIQGGLNGTFAVTVYPAFNDDAAFSEDGELYDPDFHNDGEIADWEVLTGDRADPDRIPLPSLEEPATIRTGTCDDASVTYDRRASGLSADVSGAADGERVPLRLPSGSNDAVRFDRAAVTAAGDDGSIVAVNRRPAAATQLDAEVLGALTVSDGADVADGPVTVEFTVEKAALDEQDVRRDDVALYEHRDGTWYQSPATLRAETSDTYRFAATASSLSSLAVGNERPLSVTALEANASTVRPGAVVEFEATVESGGVPGNYTATLTVFNRQLATEHVTLGPDETETVTFVQRFDTEGTHPVTVGDAQTEITVESDAGSDGESVPLSGFRAVTGLVALAVSLGLWAARTRRFCDE